MTKKGFTIIELLTTIIVLAFVSLIIAPIFIDFIKDANEGSAKNGAYGLLDAARNYHTLEMTDKGVLSSVTITFPKGIKNFEYNGDLPESGTLVIDTDGKMELGVEYGDYCATKPKTTDTVKITKKRLNCGLLSYNNLVTNGYGELNSNKNFSGFVYNSDKSFSITTSASVSRTNDEFIPVDTKKKYIQSLDIKASNTTAGHYIGFAEYDRDKKTINAQHVMYINGSTTTLAKDLNNGDTVVHLTSTAGFKVATTTPTYQLGFIFWNYKDSTGYMYPAHTYSRNIWFDLYTYDKVDKTANTITLKTAWNKGLIKAGTKVSQSSSGGVYNYGLVGGGTATTSYTTKTNTITGEGAPNGSPARTMFRPGTKYVKMLLWTNHNKVANTTTSFRNIAFKEVE